MRKGWKTRIPERVYFEEKRENRENKRAFIEMVKRRMAEDMHEYFEQQMKDNNATH
jgi:hypothetical protein